MYAVVIFMEYEFATTEKKLEIELCHHTQTLWQSPE